MGRLVAATLAVISVALVLVAAGTASPRQPQTLSCGTLGDLQILTPPAYGSDQNWGSAQIIGGGHLTPVAFQFSAFDNTVNLPLFDSGLALKGGGHANGQQATTTCSQVQTGKLADFLQPGDEVPPATYALTDNVTFTLWAQVVAK